MNPKAICFTCDHWHAMHPCFGVCALSNDLKSDTDSCEKHVPVEIKLNDKLKNPPQPVDKEEWFS